MEDYMLTTIDNPFNPYTQFDEWFAFDEQKGYHSCGLLARIAKTSDEFYNDEDNFESEQNLSILRAIDDIIKLNPLGIYTKVYKDQT